MARVSIYDDITVFHIILVGGKEIYVSQPSKLSGTADNLARCCHRIKELGSLQGNLLTNVGYGWGSWETDYQIVVTWQGIATIDIMEG